MTRPAKRTTNASAESDRADTAAALPDRERREALKTLGKTAYATPTLIALMAAPQKAPGVSPT